METRNLSAGFEVSALGYGCMGISHAYGAALAENEGMQVIRSAFDAGYTLFDTAEVYGTTEDPHHNEKIVGKALAPIRDQVQIVSKFGLSFDLDSSVRPYPLFADAAPNKIRKSIEGTLKRLNTDHVDLYLQHRMDPKVAPEVVAETMAALVKEGKILHWGISECTEEYLRRAHEICPVAAVEMRYSMMARSVEALFPALEELGVGMLAFSPMANGLLTGSYQGKSDFDASVDYRAAMPQFGKEADLQNKSLFDLLNDAAQRHSATSAQISLAWMMAKKPWIVPIPGSRNPMRLKENAGAASVQLSQDEVTAMDAALDEMETSAVFGGSRVDSAEKGDGK